MAVEFIAILKVSNEGGKVSVYPETIRMDDIKSIRVWGKTEEEKLSVKGEMIGIYMKGNESRTPSIRVAESKASFDSRLNAVQLNNMKDDREEKKFNQETR